jgi:alanine racemase
MANEQMTAFAGVVTRLRAAGLQVPLLHLANSAAAIYLPETHYNMVRPGLAIYGYQPRDSATSAVALRPSLRLVSHLVLVKQVPAGHAVGYGRTFVTRRPSVLGVVPIGYNDGYLRALSNRATMGLPAGDAPVVGAISMDQTMIDLTDLMAHDPPPKVGDEVVIIDNHRSRPNSVESLARLLGTLAYEVTCLLGNRVAREGV